MVTEPNKPLVTAAELEALIQDWGAQPHPSVDRFFPLRFWYLCGIALLYAGWLLFASDVLAQTLSKDPTEIARLSNFLYFRGWFLAVMVVLGVYAYYKNWYLGLIFSAMLLVGSVNFVFDLFNVYAERLSQPTPRLTLMMILRLTALWFMYLSVKNISRLPPGLDRFNLLLPFKRAR